MLVRKCRTRIMKWESGGPQCRGGPLMMGCFDPPSSYPYCTALASLTHMVWLFSSTLLLGPVRTLLANPRQRGGTALGTASKVFILLASPSVQRSRAAGARLSAQRGEALGAAPEGRPPSCRGLVD